MARTARRRRRDHLARLKRYRTRKLYNRWFGDIKHPIDEDDAKTYSKQTQYDTRYNCRCEWCTSGRLFVGKYFSNIDDWNEYAD